MTQSLDITPKTTGQNLTVSQKLEGHSVERITSDKVRHPTAQLIRVFVVLNLDL